MSLRWIQATREAPTCDEESSDIDDSDDSDDSCDTELSIENYDRKRSTDRLIADEEKGRDRRDDDEGKLPCIMWDPRKSMLNPVYRSALIRLWCRTGYHLIVSETGRVLATSSADEPQGLFAVTEVTFGVIRIQNPHSGRYLAFNKAGHLYGETNEKKDSAEWERWTIGNYEAFRSRKYVEHSWWMGIKRNGRIKSGSRTSWGQKAIQFVAIRSN